MTTPEIGEKADFPDDVSLTFACVILQFSVLGNAPDWAKLARNGLISDHSADLLTTMSTFKDVSSLKDLLSTHPQVLNVLRICV